MNILITGATGFIGSRLSSKLSQSGHSITIFTRKKENINAEFTGFRIFQWDYRYPDEWQKIINEHDVIIHLAGVNIFGQRWDTEYKQKIVDSRETSTRNIVKAIDRSDTNVKVLISASAIGYYGETDSIGATESSPPGDDFLAEVCRKWEEPTHKADEKGIRRINMRMGLILSTQEGYLNRLITPYMFFVGGPLGSGKSIISWIHIEDVIEAYKFAIENVQLSGAVNLTSPNPASSREFASYLGSALKRPSFFTVPETAIKFIVGEGARYVTYSQKVIPEKLQKCGFHFRYPELKTALEDLIMWKK